MAELLIEASGVDTFYGVSHILHGVDFTVRQGETIGLMGRNLSLIHISEPTRPY